MTIRERERLPRFARWTLRRASQGKAKWLRHLLLHFKKLLNASIQRSQDYLAALGGPSGGLNKEKQNGFAIYFCISKSF
jgi:hypothetical protein